MSGDPVPPTGLGPGDATTSSGGSEGRGTSAPELGQLVPAAVGALAILIVLAARGTKDVPSPLAIFAMVALGVAVIFGVAGAWPNRMSIAMRVSAWDVAVRTGYLALAAAALYVVQEIVVIRLGDSAVAQSDELLALELLGLLLVALFVARLGVPRLRRPGLGSMRGSLSPLANARGVLYGLLTVMAVMFFALVAFAQAPGTTGTPAVGTGLAVSGAALAFGALLGLLFGIPRSMQGASPSGETPATGGQRYRSNTNLEEISDWLTKIIVGVSLTQLGEIEARATGLIGAVAAGFGGSNEAKAFAAGLLTTAVIAGFLASYLVTRLYLRRALDEADQDEVVERIATEAAEKKAIEVAAATTASQEDQSQADAEANLLATRQLDVASPEVPVTELAAAFKGASPSMRVVLLGIAQQQRSKYWPAKEPGDLVKMERTIAVFQALLEADAENHQIHGQLGFALKDKATPDYDASIAELTKAIALREKTGETGWLFYEFNRAIARIRAGQEIPDEILNDLCAASANDYVRGIVEQSKDTVPWLTAQNIDPTKLGEFCAKRTEKPVPAPKPDGG